MSRRTDLAFGRRGGRFVPDGYQPTNVRAAPTCEICGLGMVLGQKRRHFLCDPESTPAQAIAQLEVEAGT